MIKRIFIAGMLLVMMFSMQGCGSKPAKASAENIQKSEPVQAVEAFGTVKSTDIRNINIDFAAVVSKVNVIEGQKVKNGDVLLSLNTQNYQSQIRTKEYELNTLKIELNGLIRDFGTKQNSLNQNSDPDIKRYINDRKYAEELYNKTLEDFASKEALYNTGAVSKNELEEFRKIVKEKKKVLDDAQLGLDNTKWKLQMDLEQLKTSIDRKNSEAASLELYIGNMKEKLNKNCIKDNDVIADVPNGVVSEIACVQGDIVVATEEGKKIISVINTDTLLIEANVAEEFIRDVRAGADVNIIPQADKSRSYKGKVMSISEKAVQKNNETVIPVRISILNNDSFLVPEFNVNVKINTADKKQE